MQLYMLSERTHYSQDGRKCGEIGRVLLRAGLADGKAEGVESVREIGRLLLSMAEANRNI